MRARRADVRRGCIARWVARAVRGLVHVGLRRRFTRVGTSIPRRSSPRVQLRIFRMTTSSAPSAVSGNGVAILRAHAEQQFATELQELARTDARPRPPSWRLSPWAVATYLLGGRTERGAEVTPKYIGNRRLIQAAIANLGTERPL